MRSEPRPYHPTCRIRSVGLDGYSTAIRKKREYVRHCPVPFGKAVMIAFRTSGLRVVLFGILASVVAALSLSQDSAAKFSLAISAPDSVILDSPFYVEIRIMNTSQEVLSLDMSRHGNFPDGYTYFVRNEKGDLISGSPCSKQASKRAPPLPPCVAPGSFRTGSLRPGEASTTSARLSDKYSFDQPGRYTIQVGRQEPGMPFVYSNILTLAVLPKP